MSSRLSFVEFLRTVAVFDSAYCTPFAVAINEFAIRFSNIDSDVSIRAFTPTDNVSRAQSTVGVVRSNRFGTVCEVQS